MIEIIFTFVIIWFSFGDLIKDDLRDFKNGTGQWIIRDGKHYIRRYKDLK
jgi:hypothetical protein